MNCEPITIAPDTPWTRPWPEEGLERLGRCPVCGGGERELLHEALKDAVFFCAPGCWTMWRCGNCRSGYLDPRPTVATIGQAYTSYYTHEMVIPKQKSPITSISSLVDHVRKRFRPAYWNATYGHRIKPDFGPANILTRTLPETLTLHWDYYIRHMPKAEPGMRLLDIGCGNGNFLRIAATLGYDVMGLEMDAVAVSAARTLGFDIVEGALPETGLPAGMFDYVTFNHVLEHLHDPVTGIREIYRVLASGGRVWLQLPNIDARGHALYGPAWRGLEPPRHLVLPALGALKEILKSVGFTRIELLKPADAILGYFLPSEAIHQALSGAENLQLLISARERTAALIYERQFPEQHEQLALVAYKL